MLLTLALGLDTLATRLGDSPDAARGVGGKLSQSDEMESSELGPVVPPDVAAANWLKVEIGEFVSQGWCDQIEYLSSRRPAFRLQIEGL